MTLFCVREGTTNKLNSHPRPPPPILAPVGKVGMVIARDTVGMVLASDIVGTVLAWDTVGMVIAWVH